METKVEEIWKPVPGIEKYHASTLGRIKNIRTGRIVRGENSKGYRRLEIWDSETKTPYRVFMHRMVLITFVPNPHNKPCSNHKNGRRWDNRVENLEWVTHQENIKHANKSGFCLVGSERYNAKLTESDIPKIRQMIKDGVKQKDIAVKFDIAASVIHKIKKGTHWSHC